MVIRWQYWNNDFRLRMSLPKLKHTLNVLSSNKLSSILNIWHLERSSLNIFILQLLCQIISKLSFTCTWNTRDDYHISLITLNLFEFLNKLLSKINLKSLLVCFLVNIMEWWEVNELLSPNLVKFIDHLKF